MKRPGLDASRSSQYSSIAGYLFRCIPDFPEKPWKDVDRSVQRAEIKKVEDSGAALFRNSACNIYPIEIFTVEILSGDRKLHLERYADNEFTLFKIDYTRSESAILEAFKACLKSRTIDSKTRFPKAKVGVGVSQTRGAKDNKSALSDRLRALAGARVIVDAKKAEYAWEKTKGRNADEELYGAEQSAWRRAKGRALYCLQRLEELWRFNGRIGNPLLVRERAEGQIDPGWRVSSKAPLTGDEIKVKQLKSLEEQFRETFISPLHLRYLLTVRQ